MVSLKPAPGATAAQSPAKCVPRCHADAPQAEAANQNAILVDRVQPLHGIQRFEKVHLAGQLAPIAESAVEVQNDGVFRSELARTPLAVGEEVDLAQGLAAAVEPRVEPPPPRRGRGI